ncbi:MAG: glyoxalase [Microbacteriaceae bacterium]|nr:MAG: glyoxalase [Microbacteriaceae bacterium]
MEARITAITLGVRDRAASRRFYVDGLGWAPTAEVEGDVVFIQAGHGLLLCLWSVDDLAADAGEEIGFGHNAPPISLGQNVASVDEVYRILDAAVAAGADMVAPARKQPWGGVSGYFADPDGFRWEIVYNPGLTFDEAGNASFSEGV